ncbi:uncharacterized protein LOC143083747 isoform X2 [Mytilus galloprovincialis]|uniref:uncharacterized protein LOC143083747 isoform X2 n=1 Tax=Mytilus galloprovincialis TaxID=29158 RepID=UPI003F7CABE2
MTEHGGINVGDKFSSFSALNTRIRQYEVQKNIEFYKRDSRTIESARKRGIKRELSEDLQFYQIRYSCINGGKEHNSKANGERPKQSSFRKGCPAYISVGVSEDGKFLVVKSIEDHHNHVISKGLFEMLPRERRLPEEELKEAEKLVSLQVNNKLMRDHLQDKTGKKVILKDISNIISKVNASKKSDNIESLVSKLKKTGSVVEVFHDLNNQVQGVFYQDEEMQKIFSAYCDIIFVDATYKLNDLRMPLYVIMIEDSLGQSEVAAICLLNSEEKPVLQHLIKCFQKHNPDSSGIKVIMADKDIVERDVFKEEFPDASLLICKFHVLRTFNREITTEKMGISSAQRYVALELIQKLVHSSSEEDYNANLKLIETTCPRQIFNYIDTNWHNIRNEWVLGLTYFEGSLMNTTNNRIESFNQKLKQVIKLYSGLDLFFENFISLIGTLRNERDYKGSVEIQKVPVHIKAMNTTSAEYKYSQLLTGYASYFVIDELKKARKMETIFKTTNSTSHSDDDMELNTNSCTCNFRKSMGLPCKHIFFARLLISIDLFGTELCVSRWTRSYYRENTRLFSPMVSPSKTFCNSSNKVSNASQVVDPRNTTLLSENQKYKKAFFVAQKLAAACSAVGMKEFMSRMKLLTEIEELWKNNHTVEVEDSCTESTVEADSCFILEGQTIVPENASVQCIDIVLEEHTTFPENTGVECIDISVPTTSHRANSIASVNKDGLSIAVQEFIHTIADQSAALCAEKGTCRIDGDEVKNCLEELLPSAEMLLNLNNQAAAKPYFTEEGWLTVESILRILEDQYLKQIKRKEFPSNVSQKKGKGKKTSRKNCSPTKGIESEGNNRKRKRDVPDLEDNICNDKDGTITFFPDVMETMQSLRGEIIDFIKTYDPKKVLPRVGNPINTVFKYHDGTRSLSDDQRDSITQYLCTFQEVRSLSHIDNASLIHSLIEFIIKRKTENDLHQNNGSLSDLKMPTKLKRKGRPKGSQQTVIGLPKKRGKNKLVPFFKRTVDEKEREILSWLVSVDSVMKSSGGTLLDEEDLVGLSEDSLPYRCLDDYVDLTIVQKNFTSSAWLYLSSIVKEKQQKGGYILCTYCNVFITTENDDAVECDFCLLWWHISCIKLKSKPKVKHWYCKSCR